MPNRIIKNLFPVLALLFPLVTQISAAPAIATLGAKNSASYANAGFQNGAIAQGSLFVVFGSGMGPAQIQNSGSFPLPTTLAGTSASVTVSGTTVACIMIYTSDGQIAAILPSTTPVGTGTITVTYNGAASPTAPITVAAVSPGLFTRNQQGSGPAVVQDANYNYNSFANAFQPGETVTFWGTGFGAISGNDAAPPPSGNLPGTTVTALVGGQSATVTYAGRSGFAGVDQINVTIPSGVSGCFVSVGLFDNGVPSNFTSIAVTPSGAVCSDPNLFTSADIQNIANGNPMRLGTSLLSQYSATGSLLGLSLTVDYETGKAYFQQYTSANFLNSLTALGELAVSSGSCGVFQYSNSSFIDPVPATGLDAGAINVSGGGATKPLPSTVTGNYQATFSSTNPLMPNPPFLTPGGTFTLATSGGANVGAFNFNSTLPAKITWTNKPTAGTVSRSQDLQITWSGGDPNSYVYIFGESPLDSNGNGADFTCVAANSAGGITVPKAILSALPPSATTTLDGLSIPGGILIVNATTVTRQSATGLDVFLSGTSTGDAKAAFSFQ